MHSLVVTGNTKATVIKHLCDAFLYDAFAYDELLTKVFSCD